MAATASERAPVAAPLPDHVDVLVVGAGLSGIGAACHLTLSRPGSSYVVLEARETMGGTWDLFRYPGVRSDSDMFTLGYSFRPWTRPKAIADAASILDYIRETAREFGVERNIHYRRRVVRAEWSSEQAQWTVDVEHTDTGARSRLTCGFVLACSGYYRYDEGYLPEFAGMERFRGPIVHPQHWPDDLDYAGKRVVVVGSGATAVTLVPAMAKDAAHVTMLQRSPTYIVSLPGRDPLADLLRRVLPPRAVYPFVKWKNVLLTSLSYRVSKRWPHVMKGLIRKGLERQLPADYDIDTHFTPRYNPWDQRLCVVPDGDLFKAIARGHASVVTDRVKTFTETGIELESGACLDADVVVTATGLNMLANGGMQLVVDGHEVDASRTVAYKGMMFSGVPNFAIAVGYTNASWTLKCDLVCRHVMRLLDHMDAHGHRMVVPRWSEPELPDQPLLDLTSGYVLRSIDKFPKQGRRAPWRLYQNYLRDLLLLRFGSVEDEALEFSRGGGATSAPRRLTA